MSILYLHPSNRFLTPTVTSESPPQQVWSTSGNILRAYARVGGDARAMFFFFLFNLSRVAFSETFFPQKAAPPAGKHSD